MGKSFGTKIKNAVKVDKIWEDSLDSMSTNFFDKASNVLPLHLKQTFPPIIWIFTEGKGDGIESRLSSQILSTLLQLYKDK